MYTDLYLAILPQYSVGDAMVWLVVGVENPNTTISVIRGLYRVRA